MAGSFQYFASSSGWSMRVSGNRSKKEYQPVPHPFLQTNLLPGLEIQLVTFRL